ncbi:MAG: SIS domain-containing protein [Bacteriovoracaceae bacterium]|jgi:D-sedoheptulose 7-phosphate isomerase|nr:phosphoheptose isomerase [Halobacteriovoraceae bacterium]MDP7318971.1 SIS domain-containing protein [Bacteriovoracaceae bacterium]|tara:strand:+ start:185 stop:778 length:594 start_codon:yes stop_codon:yes gene_type:complete
MNTNYIQNALKECQTTLNKFLENPQHVNGINQAVESFAKTLKSEGRILACGNGGSMCDSLHFVEELTGRYRKDRDPLCALSMGDAGHITCVANDFGFEHIFSRNVQAWGRPGDTLLAISTSGNSQNIIKAVEVAKAKGITVVGLLGKTGGKLKDMVDIPLVVESQITDRIQEIHIKMIHIFIEGIERQLFPEHYDQA